MAKQGKDEHRMLFDLQGKRRNVVKVVYAVLAVLMGVSLLLVAGPLPFGDIFGNQDATEQATEQLEQQAERAEVKLAKDPDNPDLMVAVMRAHINAANNQIEVTGAGPVVSVEARQQLEQASAAWSEYLETSKEPNASAAQLVVPSLVLLAETSRSTREGEANIQAAAEAQEIVAEQRPSLNSLTTLALYSTFTFDYAAAEKARDEALALATSKPQRDEINKRFDETLERAKAFEKEQEEAAKVGNELQEEANEGGGGGGTSGNPFGSALGGGATGE